MPPTLNPTRSQNSPITTQKVAFAALQHRHFRGFFFSTMLAMMADNIEHVISYWVLFRRFCFYLSTSAAWLTGTTADD